VHDAGQIERTIRAFARTPNNGMILTATAFAQFHRKPIITLADRHKLPTVYFQRALVADGGLVSYGLMPAPGWQGEFFTSQASKKIATILLKFKVHWENLRSLGDGNAHDAQVYSSGREEQRINQRRLTRAHDGIDPEQT